MKTPMKTNNNKSRDKKIAFDAEQNLQKKKTEILTVRSLPLDNGIPSTIS